MRAYLLRMMPLVLAYAAIAWYFVAAERQGPYILRNLLPPAPHGNKNGRFGRCCNPCLLFSWQS